MADHTLTLRSLAIWVVSLGLCLSAAGTIVNHWRRQEIVRDRERDLVRLKEENRDLEAALQESKEDAYVERIARDKLGLVKEGEVIVIMPGEQAEGERGSAGDPRPNWKKWWNLFF